MADRYWIGNTGLWTDTDHWSTSSGGAGGASVPTDADDVFIDANSFTEAGQYIEFENVISPFIFSITGDSFTLPLLTTADGGVYDFTVDWGDGSAVETVTEVTTAIIHSYSYSSTYDITISGTMEGWGFASPSIECAKIMEIKQWGCFSFKNHLSTPTPEGEAREIMFGGLEVVEDGAHFTGCSNMIITATDIPDLVGAKSLYGSFYGATSLTEIPNFNNWDFSTIECMAATFIGCALFNQELSLTLPLIRSFAIMLGDASEFNSSITLNITHDNNVGFAQMFANTTNTGKFNSPITINTIDANLYFCSYVFYGNPDFNQPISLETNGFVDCRALLIGAFGFNSPITIKAGGNIDCSQLMNGTFGVNTMIFNKPIYLEAGGDINCQTFLNGAILYNDSLYIKAGGDINCTTMLYGATSFNQPVTLDIGGDFVPIGGGYGCYYAFVQSGEVEEDNIFNSKITLIAPNITVLDYFLFGASSFDQDVSDWDISNVESMYNLFEKSGMSTENYSKTLIGWETQDVQDNVILTSSAKYNSGAQSARDHLVNVHGWTINDAGLES